MPVLICFHFGQQGTVFDYYVDEASGSMLSWETKVQGFQYMPDSFSNLFVPTVETTRLTYFLNSLMENKHYVMFVGNTGEILSDLAADRMLCVDAAKTSEIACNMQSVAWYRLAA